MCSVLLTSISFNSKKSMCNSSRHLSFFCNFEKSQTYKHGREWSNWAPKTWNFVCPRRPLNLLLFLNSIIPFSVHLCIQDQVLWHFRFKLPSSFSLAVLTIQQELSHIVLSSPQKLGLYWNASKSARTTNVFTYLGCFKEHFSLIHCNFEGVGLRCSKENNVLVLESLQWFRISTFVDRHILCADSKPKIIWKASLLTLQKQKSCISTMED